ncbi:class F sortase, partial [Streptomyces sp. NPDC058479]|uniref:class F sortase n=3 Tax=unclassified Streptomyces TaxID=2593676 RepID=UPI00366189FA
RPPRPRLSRRRACPAGPAGHAGPPPERPGPKAPGAREATPGPSASAHPSPAPAGGPRTLPPSRATRILIPYLELDAPLMQLRLDEKRRLPAPPADKPKLAGWYADGPAPGAPGTAVAVGHLDTDSGPAVFAGLSQLKPGRRIEIRRADGRTAVYTVDALKKYEKSDFPNQEVYGARDRPELRLITCGGAWDRRSGYSGNLVVFAHLTRTT